MQEIDRKTSTRRIFDPASAAADGTPPAPSDSDIIVLVIDEITFIDPKDKYQQTTWSLDNSNASSRDVHAFTITGSDGASKLSVERIDQYDALDPKDHYQETRTTLDNASEARFAIDYAPTGADSRTTHDVKIYSKDGSSWLVMRRTDSFSVTDPKDRYQETTFTLDNKDLDAGDPAPTNLDPPTTDWDGTTINPPWRFDPYQNVIDVQFGGCLLVFYDGNKIKAFPMSKLATLTSGDAMYAKTLASSSWYDSYNSRTRMDACQLKLSDVFSPVLTPFKLTEGAVDPVTGKTTFTIALDPKWRCYNLSKGHSLLKGFATSTISNWSDPAQNTTSGGLYVLPAYPMINGAGSKAYFNGDVFSVNSSKDVSAAPNSSLFCTWLSGDGTRSIQTPDMVTSAGAYYWGVAASYSGISVVSGSSFSAWSDAAQAAINDRTAGSGGSSTPPDSSLWFIDGTTGAGTTAYSGSSSLTSNGIGYSMVVEGSGYTLTLGSGSSASTWSYGASVQDIHVGTGLAPLYILWDPQMSFVDTATGSGSYDAGSHLLVYSQSGGYDRLTLTEAPFIGSESARAKTAGSRVETDVVGGDGVQVSTLSGFASGAGSYSFLGVSGSYSDVQTTSASSPGLVISGGNPGFHPAASPPSGSTTDTITSSANHLSVFYFPYALGTKMGNGVWGATADDSGHFTNYTASQTIGGASGQITPWLHISNGKHVIQGAAGYGGADPLLYLDGKNWGARLAAAVGVSLSQIDCLLMDVPLGDVKRLT
jgi:hypothetical protein